MTAFASALDVLFCDPHLSVAARYRAQDRGEGRPVRVIRRRPDEVTGFGDAQILSEAQLIDVRVADLAEIAAGDSFEIAGARFRVQGSPRADRERLVWTVALVPARI